MKTSKSRLTIIVCATLLPSCSPSQPPAVPVQVASSPSANTETETRNSEQRLARAADVRIFYKDQDMNVKVVADGTTLRVHFANAHANYMEQIRQTFCQQHETRIGPLLEAGFETLQLEAYDSFGKVQVMAFPLSDCKSESS
jgi:hypothetical protein